MRYVRVDSIPDAVEALSEPKAHLIAGGTDLLVKIRGGIASPKVLVDISDIDDLRGIRVSDDVIEMGAATSEEDIRRHEVIASEFPLLAEVLAQLGSVQIRNRGTLGGNLVNASPAADSAIPLLLYGAVAKVFGPAGERTIPLGELFVGPGKTTLAPNDVVVTLQIPRTGRPWISFFHKVGKRRALTISIASVGALLEVESGRIIEARIAAGSVAPTPLRLAALEGHLTGAALDEVVIAEAAAVAVEEVSPISDVRASGDYRRQVVGELVERALRSAMA